ncbi:DUF6702 family protein [Flavitalea flava]
MAVSLFKWLTLLKWCFSAVFFMPLQDKEGTFPTAGNEGICFTSGEEEVGRIGTPGKARHPLYIGVMEISHNAKDKSLEVSCKLFTNDLEATLEKVTHTKVDLSDAKNKTFNDKLISEYVQKHVQIKVDGRSVSLQFAGCENEAEGTWSYFQVSNVPSLKRLDITNNLLYDNFDKQINIIHGSAGGIRKSTRLNYPDTNAVLEF